MKRLNITYQLQLIFHKHWVRPVPLIHCLILAHCEFKFNTPDVDTAPSGIVCQCIILRLYQQKCVESMNFQDDCNGLPNKVEFLIQYAYRVKSSLSSNTPTKQIRISHPIRAGGFFTRIPYQTYCCCSTTLFWRLSPLCRYCASHFASGLQWMNCA